MRAQLSRGYEGEPAPSVSLGEYPSIDSRNAFPQRTHMGVGRTADAFLRGISLSIYYKVYSRSEYIYVIRHKYKMTINQIKRVFVWRDILYIGTTHSIRRKISNKCINTVSSRRVREHIKSSQFSL